jgi:deferrochelatase/peroxidase EfeB
VRASTQAPAVELDDVQGLLRFGYKHHTQSCFLLLRVKNREAARAWLAAMPVSSAMAAEPPPETALQVALSSEGLLALDVAPDIVGAFSAEFVSGLGNDANRARRLGDVGANHPSQWSWGSGPRVPHVLLLLYALPGRLQAWQASIQAECEAGFELLETLTNSDMHGFEPFGFRDGISQPQLDWERRRPVRDTQQPAYSNLSCLGEVLLGYPNEYGGYTDRPLLDPQRDAQAQTLPRAEDAPQQADLGRNGSYLVLRQLQQDVHGFWQYLHRQAGGDAMLREQLGAAMVGRTRQGVSLVQPAHAGGIGKKLDLNDFNYLEDRHGLRCPLGAHVRRANPRTADLPPGAPGIVSWLERTLGFDAAAREQDRVASTRFHRLLRRGREYGSAVSPEQALSGDGTAAPSGIHFICLGANIARQFEFVQGAWIAGTRFEGLPGESDPLLGMREQNGGGSTADIFSMPQPDGPDRRLTGLPPFVTVRGGAYFFMPGIRALRYLMASRS